MTDPNFGEASAALRRDRVDAWAALARQVNSAMQQDFVGPSVNGLDVLDGELFEDFEGFAVEVPGGLGPRTPGSGQFRIGTTSKSSSWSARKRPGRAAQWLPAPDEQSRRSPPTSPAQYLAAGCCFVQSGYSDKPAASRASFRLSNKRVRRKRHPSRSIPTTYEAPPGHRSPRSATLNELDQDLVVAGVDELDRVLGQPIERVHPRSRPFPGRRTSVCARVGHLRCKDELNVSGRSANALKSPRENCSKAARAASTGSCDIASAVSRDSKPLLSMQSG